MSDDWDKGVEVQSNWFKFENVGDKIKGTLIEKSIHEGDGNFADQLVSVLEKADGSRWNVGISVKKTGTVGRVNNCKIGEIIGFIFDSEGDAPKKGFNKVKNIKVLSWGMNPDFGVGAEEVAEGEDLAEKVKM